MKTKMILLFTMVLAFTISSAGAQVAYHSKTQQERIKHGYKNGKLTPAEASRLAHQQRFIHKDVRRAKCNDGRISRSERQRIMRKQQMADRQIYSYNHNRRSRF
jgi:uncharacterized membrane protein YebE (DUF533 family)